MASSIRRGCGRGRGGRSEGRGFSTRIRPRLLYAIEANNMRARGYGTWAGCCVEMLVKMITPTRQGCVWCLARNETPGKPSLAFLYSSIQERMLHYHIYSYYKYVNYDHRGECSPENVTPKSPSTCQCHPKQSFSGLHSPSDHNLRTYDMTPGFKPFTVLFILSLYIFLQHFLTSFGKIRNQPGRRWRNVSRMGTFDPLFTQLLLNLFFWLSQ